MKTRILLVEDDPALRKLLKDALPESIFVIDIAETGREGLDMIVKRKPDLILLDWNLPDLNGFEVCKYIKQNKDCAHIPIIMVTAYSELNRKVSALDVAPTTTSQNPSKLKSSSRESRRSSAAVKVGHLKSPSPKRTSPSTSRPTRWTWIRSPSF